MREPEGRGGANDSRHLRLQRPESSKPARFDARFEKRMFGNSALRSTDVAGVRGVHVAQIQDTGHADRSAN